MIFVYKKKIKKNSSLFTAALKQNQIFFNKFLTEKLKIRNFFKIKYFFIFKKKASLISNTLS